MVRSCDVGSMPFIGDFKRFLKGAEKYSNLSAQDGHSHRYFEKKVVNAFIDKIKTGIDLPNYPQFRNMNEMFLQMIDCIEKINGRFLENRELTIKEGTTTIPEIASIRSNSKEIQEKTGNPFKLRICITGPYTLSSLFLHRDTDIFNRIARIISKIVEKNIFHSKHGSVEQVAIDEPIFNFLDDPLLDYGNEGRENLLGAWEMILQKAKSRKVSTSMHLHNTGNNLFWELESLDIIESHVQDEIYSSDKTRSRLELEDKYLKASIGTTIFDDLIRKHPTTKLYQTKEEDKLNKDLTEIWKKINSKQIDPKIFLESAETMKHRLKTIIGKFGIDRIPYASPECGLMNFPTYDTALEVLRRTARATERLDN